MSKRIDATLSSWTWVVHSMDLNIPSVLYCYSICGNGLRYDIFVILFTFIVLI